MAAVGLRKTASLVFVSSLVWDLYRDLDRLEDLSMWAVIVHFWYFQLPMKSRALAALHPLSFTGAIVVPTLYLYSLIRKPNLEVERIVSWELPLTTLICRSVAINFAPLVFHALDLSRNQQKLVDAYRLKPKKAQTMWVATGFFILQLVHEMFYPMNNGDPYSRSFPRIAKIISIAVSIFSFSILYSSILKRAHYSQRS